MCIVPSASAPTRRAFGTLVGLAGVLLVVAVLTPLHARVGEGTPGLVLVVPVVVAGLIGGAAASLVVAVGASVAYLFGFIPPIGTFRVDLPADIVVLATFLAVAAVVGTLVARVESRRVAAEQRTEELVVAHAKLAEAEAERANLLVERERARALEEVDRQRTALLRSVSHDLRTPLVTIRAVASDLVSGTVYDETTTGRLLHLVAREADRLDRLVANLLDMSRIEAGALRPVFDDVSLADIVDGAATRLDTLLGSVRIVQALPADLPDVRADHALLGQVVTNLLENAVRFSPDDGVVEVGASIEGAIVTATVRDHGPGLQGADPATLFRPFSSTSVGHTGLGLAICLAVVEAHGGTISALDEIDGGATFWFTIPVAP